MQTPRLNILFDFLKEDPTDPFNKYAVAMELMNQDSERAIQFLEELIEEHPEYLPTYYQLGSVYAQRNDERTIKIFNEGIALAEKKKNLKTLRELKGALQLYMDEQDED